MRQENRAAPMALRGFREKRVARVTRCGLERHLFFLRQRANVRRAEFKIDLIFPGQFFYKACIGIARSSAQLMVQMTNDQFLVTEIDQPVEQRDGIAPTGNADQIRPLGRKSSQQICFLLNPSHRRTASNVQNQS